MKMNPRLEIGALALLFAIGGCSDRSTDSSVKPERADGTNVTQLVSYDSLSTNDVIVVVDGKALTKAELEKRVDFAISIAKAQGKLLGNSQLSTVKPRLRRSESRRYVSETLLLNAARNAGVETTSNALEIAKSLVVAADGDGPSFDVIESKFTGEKRKLFDALINDSALIFSYIMSLACESVQVSEADIDDVVDYANTMKESSVATLEEQRQKALDIYKRLTEGESFEDLAGESFTADEDSGVGEWGDFSISSLEPFAPGIAKEVATLKIGEFTKPLEMDDAIYIVKLEEITRASDDIPEHDVMTLKRIVVPLPILYEVGSRESIRRDLFLERINKYQTETLLPELQKKATIEYPNGRISYATKKDLRKENKQ